MGNSLGDAQRGSVLPLPPGVIPEGEGPAQCHPVPKVWWDQILPWGSGRTLEVPPQPGSDFEGGFSCELCCPSPRPIAAPLGLLCLMCPWPGCKVIH